VSGARFNRVHLAVTCADVDGSTAGGVDEGLRQTTTYDSRALGKLQRSGFACSRTTTMKVEANRKWCCALERRAGGCDLYRRGREVGLKQESTLLDVNCCAILIHRETEVVIAPLMEIWSKSRTKESERSREEGRGRRCGRACGGNQNAIYGFSHNIARYCLKRGECGEEATSRLWWSSTLQGSWHRLLARTSVLQLPVETRTTEWERKEMRLWEREGGPTCHLNRGEEGLDTWRLDGAWVRHVRFIFFLFLFLF
jgi:hypothetical protein